MSAKGAKRDSQGAHIRPLLTSQAFATFAIFAPLRPVISLTPNNDEPTHTCMFMMSE